MNPIKQILTSKIQALMDLSRGADSITHMAARGVIRESYLKDFYADVIPSSLSIEAGFICDSYGNSTPQLDMVVIDRSFLPPMSMAGDVSVIPVESALMVAEIKSTLTRQAFDQVQRQVDSIKRLRLAHRQATNDLAVIPQNAVVPSIILAYDSEVKSSSFIERFNELHGLVGVCVIEKYVILDDPTSSDGCRVIPCEEGKPFAEVLQFISTIYHTLVSLAEFKRPPRSNLEAYLTCPKTKDNKALNRSSDSRGI